MSPLKGSQRKYLRGLAHSLNPSALVGQKGITPALIGEIRQALEASELIKIKFVDHKDKEIKTALTDEICRQTGAAVAGMVGHVVVLYRRNPDPEKRKIILPG